MSQYSPGRERPTSGPGGVRRRGRCPLAGGHSKATGGWIDSLRGETPPFGRSRSSSFVARNWLRREVGPDDRIPGKVARNMRPNPRWSRLLLPVFLGALLSFGGRVTAVRADDRDPDPEYGSTFGRVRYLEGG